MPPVLLMISELAAGSLPAVLGLREVWPDAMPL
jgi:hypothetical protein